VEATFDLDGYRYALELDPTWVAMELPGARGAWRAPQAWRGFTPNATLVHAAGRCAHGEALFEQVGPPLLDELDDPLLIDVEMPHQDDLRMVVSHRIREHRVTLLQRLLVHDDTAAVTLSVTIPDLLVDRLRDAWTLPLRSLTRTELVE
jgi:hypothetical protein